MEPACPLGPSCPNDAFTTSGLFVKRTYQNIRFFYDKQPVNTPAVADFLSNRVITQSQTFPQASSASGFTFTWNGADSRPSTADVRPALR